MPDERLLLAIVTQSVLLGAALVNLRWSFGNYRQFRDARGLRGFVAAVTMLSGATALAASSMAIRAALDPLETLLRVLTVASVVGFCIGLIFSAVSWRTHR